ncbi:glycosyltransferase 87 family protein [Pedococcus sp. NPDC057267]|uniref:glycosyltransferase 87 family protein n=1 Tax=Pedococcus sp. NPDC057267 TaxID=3346077 RepID=UPI00363BA838
MGPGRLPTHARLGWFVAVVGVLVALLQRWTTLGHWHPLDLEVYVAGGRAVLDGVDLYSVVVTNGLNGILRFTYPPFAAIIFVPLALLGAAAGFMFTAVSAVAYVVVVVLSGRSAGLSRWQTGFLLALGLALEPVQRTILFGQVNLVLMAMVLLDTLVARSRWRGVLLGLAAGVKLTPAVVIVWYLLRREYRAAATAAGTTAMTVVVGWVLLPRDSRTFWFHTLTARGRFGPEVRLWGNQSVSAVLDRATQLHDVPAPLLTALTATLSLVLMALAVLAARRAVRVGNDLAALVAIGLGGLLVAPVSWTHHYVWVMPALAVLLGAKAWFPAGLTAVVFFLPPMWALAARPNQALGYTVPDLLLSAAWALWSMGLLGWLLRARAVARGTTSDTGGMTPTTLDDGDGRPLLASRV